MTPPPPGPAPLVNELPGEPQPYLMQFGQGVRRLTGDVLWTIVARASDTGGSFDAAYLSGPRGAALPSHSAPHQRTFLVTHGTAEVAVAGRRRTLAPGDSATVPPGAAASVRMTGHATRVLMFAAPGGTLAPVLDAGEPTELFVYPSRPAGASVAAWTEAAVSAGFTFGEEPDAEPAASADALPGGAEPFFLDNLEGDRLDWPDSLNAFMARGRNTGGEYFAVNTVGGPAPYIVQHFHARHTENFLCLSGRLWLQVNGQDVLLTPGDFVHAPPRTVHTYCLDAHQTQMVGFLTTDIFEPFFDATGDPTDAHMYTAGLVDPMSVVGRIKANPDLDVVVVGPPPERPSV